MILAPTSSFPGTDCSTVTFCSGSLCSKRTKKSLMWPLSPKSFSPAVLSLLSAKQPIPSKVGKLLLAPVQQLLSHWCFRAVLQEAYGSVRRSCRQLLLCCDMDIGNCLHHTQIWGSVSPAAVRCLPLLRIGAACLTWQQDSDEAGTCLAFAEGDSHDDRVLVRITCCNRAGGSSPNEQELVLHKAAGHQRCLKPFLCTARQISNQALPASPLSGSEGTLS